MARHAPLLIALAACLPAACQSPSPGPAAVPDANAPTGGEQRWQCGEMIVTSLPVAGGIELHRPGVRHSLTPQPVASGTQYRDDAGNAIWIKGSEATLALAGDESRDCIRTERTSPWDEARNRGVALRATGNEPGWVVEVDHGERPALRAELDYGQRRLQVPAARPLPADGNTTGFRGEASDGTAIELRIRREPCRDDMSGHPFPASAEIEVASQVYRGCAVYLRD